MKKDAKPFNGHANNVYKICKRPTHAHQKTYKQHTKHPDSIRINIKEGIQQYTETEISKILKWLESSALLRSRPVFACDKQKAI